MQPQKKKKANESEGPMDHRTVVGRAPWGEMMEMHMPENQRPVLPPTEDWPERRWPADDDTAWLTLLLDARRDGFRPGDEWTE